MKEKLLDLVAKVQVKHDFIKESRFQLALEELAKLVAKECVAICEQQVKAFDVAGNEYTVFKNHTRELCIKSIKDDLGI